LIDSAEETSVVTQSLIVSSSDARAASQAWMRAVDGSWVIAATRTEVSR
jgi:hypothetical protein